MIIQQEPTLTLKQLASVLDISEGNAHMILTKKLNFSCMCSKLVPWLFLNEIKTECVCVCKYWRDHLAAENETWFDDMITMDELWMCCWSIHRCIVDPSTKQYLSGSWKVPTCLWNKDRRDPKTRPSKSPFLMSSGWFTGWATTFFS